MHVSRNIIIATALAVIFTASAAALAAQASQDLAAKPIIPVVQSKLTINDTVTTNVLSPIPAPAPSSSPNAKQAAVSSIAKPTTTSVPASGLPRLPYDPAAKSGLITGISQTGFGAPCVGGWTWIHYNGIEIYTRSQVTQAITFNFEYDAPASSQFVIGLNSGPHTMTVTPGGSVTYRQLGSWFGYAVSEPPHRFRVRVTSPVTYVSPWIELPTQTPTTCP